MNIQEQVQHGITVFTISGRIDTQGAVELENTLQNAVQQGVTRMVLDLENVRYINSSALRTLADVITHNREHHGDLFLVNMTPRIKRVFEIIGFDRFFDFYDSVEAAINAFPAEERSS